MPIPGEAAAGMASTTARAAGVLPWLGIGAGAFMFARAEPDTRHDVLMGGLAGAALSGPGRRAIGAGSKAALGLGGQFYDAAIRPAARNLWLNNMPIEEIGAFSAGLGRTAKYMGRAFSHEAGASIRSMGSSAWRGLGVGAAVGAAIGLGYSALQSNQPIV